MGRPLPETTVTLCRDCCCGSATKHPDVDHDAQRERLLALASDRVRVRVVDCLDECDRSNVVMVREHGRPASERDTWLGGVLDEARSDAIVDWVGGGAAREVALGGVLGEAVFVHVPPPRQTTRFGPPT